MNTLHDQWEDFRKILPAGAPPIQIREMRRAFYAGAHATLALLFGVGDQKVSEDAGVALLESWHQECIEFARKVGSGGF